MLAYDCCMVAVWGGLGIIQTSHGMHTTLQQAVRGPLPLGFSSCGCSSPRTHPTTTSFRTMGVREWEECVVGMGGEGEEVRSGRGVRDLALPCGCEMTCSSPALTRTLHPPHPLAVPPPSNWPRYRRHDLPLPPYSLSLPSPRLAPMQLGMPCGIA